MHLPLNVGEGEGVELSERYKVGTTYPVFILINSAGEVVNRWTGYTGGAEAFIKTLKRMLADLTTVDERVTAFQNNPNQRDALLIARHYSDIGEHLEAVEYYRRAQNLARGTAYDYSYDIFRNVANAVWKDMIPFEEVFPAAEAVLNAKRKNIQNLIKVGQLMSRLARKKNRTDQIAKYLQAGINATADSQDDKIKESHKLLRADYALHVTGDTIQAVGIKKTSLGDGWENERDKFYEFAKWCLERKINLDEAEMYARRTVKLVFPGKYRARALNTVAEICEARGKMDDAVKLMKMAAEEDPDNPFYSNQLKRLQEE